MMRKFILFLVVLLSLGFLNFTLIFAIDGLSVKLVSDKSEYIEGEMMKLSLEVTNSNLEDIFGQLSGSSVVGNTGFDISCIEFNFPKTQGISLQILSAQAQMSTSNVKTITHYSSCGGSQSQSTQTITDNSKVISSATEELVTLSPFNLKYSFNGTEYDIKSNSLEITIRKKTEEEKEQEEKEQKEQEQQEKEQQKDQEEQKEKEQQENNEQKKQQSEQQKSEENSNDSEKSDNDMPELPKGEELSPEKQQALKNNQQNQQSLSQLKNEISKIQVNDSDLTKKNLSFDNQTLNQTLSLLEENKLDELKNEKNSFWKTVFGILLFFSLLYFIYLRYFRKEELILDRVKGKEEIFPYYLELLDLVLVEKDYKVKVKMLAQSVREFLFVYKELDTVPTNNIGLKITKNSMFKDVLKKSEQIEFARGSEKLDIKVLAENLKKEYIKLLKKETKREVNLEKNKNE